MALDKDDRDFIERLVERVGDALGEAMADEIAPIRTRLGTLETTMKEGLSVQKKTLDAQQKLRESMKTDLPKAFAAIIEPKLKDQSKAIE